MVSLERRHVGGEREEVWSEIRRLGPLPPALTPEVEAVALETMRRALRHVRHIVEGLTELGFVRAYPDVPMHTAPSDDGCQQLALLGGQIGGVPAALRACMAVIGPVEILGDCPPVGLYCRTDPDVLVPVLPDPLCLPSGVAWPRVEQVPEQ